MEILDLEFDSVINGTVAIGYANYEYTFKHLIPLINKTDFQRKLQDNKFYEKLKRDIEQGCIVPQITIAFITSDINKESTTTDTRDYCLNNIENAFILDGIQRLSTLSKLKTSDTLDNDKKLYINFIFSNSRDKLLYRMITLNNGQKPMTPRHQVEVMISNTYDFSTFDINIVTEKEKLTPNSFKKSDIIQAYLAFMANSPLVDNKKIIQEKMDGLLIDKIMSQESMNIDIDFNDILIAISKFQVDNISRKWLKVENNLIGFATGMKKSAKLVIKLSVDEFRERIEVFDEAFNNFNPSKIKVGKFRRELSCEYFREFEQLNNSNSDELLEYFSDITA
jgi:hypothetical protein